MQPNDMLQALSRLWYACLEYPEADHEAILAHIEALQVMIFDLRQVQHEQ